MSKVFVKKVRKRTSGLGIFLFFFSLIITARLVQIQILGNKESIEKILRQNRKKIDIQPQRGTIFDRNGELLARSIQKSSVYYNPQENESIKKQIKNINVLQNILNLSRIDLKKIEERIKQKDPFIWIKRKIEDISAIEIKEKKIPGIHLLEEKKRFYPQGKLGGHLLGRVNIDNIGQSGIELYYQSILAGEKGDQINFFDAKRRKYRFEITKKPIDGNDIILTLDETIQFIAEKELSLTVKEFQAEWGTVIISIPETGEILAIANNPGFDPNKNPSDINLTDRIKAVHHNYDPGSIFKIITASAALEYQAVNMNKTFDCSDGYIEVAGKNIKDHKKFEILTFPQVIIHSSNVGTVQIAKLVGDKNLYDMISKFRFGKKTGIDLPKEESGFIRPLNHWSKRSLASLSIGYEISTTPIQMLMALNTIANRGIYVAPKLLKIEKAYKKYLPKKKNSPIRIISKETAAKIDSILHHVVLEGTGKTAALAGYQIAGKTGTAQRINPETKRYDLDSHTASFAGYITDNKPLFSIIVIIDDPKGPLYYGSQVAAPVFRRIAAQMLNYLKVPERTLPQKQLIATAQQYGVHE